MEENASKTRRENENQNACHHEGGTTAGKKKRVNTLEETIKQIHEDIASAIEIARLAFGSSAEWPKVAKHLEGVKGQVGSLTREKSVTDGIGHAIMQRLDKLEKRLEQNGPQGQNVAKLGVRSETRRPKWSEVVTGATNSKATLELRMTEMNGTIPETSREKLEKIRQFIPNVAGIVPHPRATDKVSIVVPASTRENILRNGLKEGTEGFKLIRRPIQAMVLGVPLTEPITSKGSEANQKWMRSVEKENAITLTRVEWMYTQKRVDELRSSGTQKRGSVIIELPTDHERSKVIRDGLVIGAEWFRVEAWDIAMKEIQCFRCWKWGHSQSVCNNPHQLCGHCAGNHATQECKTKTPADASCAACKTKGHFAFWRKSCKAYEAFRRGRETTRTHLREATMQVLKTTKDVTAPPFSFSQPSQWTIVEPKRSVGSKMKRPCQDNGDEERRGPGRPRGTTVAANARGQTTLRSTNSNDNINTSQERTEETSTIHQ
jgi:hypothetical protein